MQTPFQILQNKKRQDKKRINFSKQKRNIHISYQSPQNKSFLSDKNNATDQSQRQLSRDDLNISPDSIKMNEKKYQIVFRQSIRKFSTFRNKVYHTHTALKNQNFIKKFITQKSGSKSQRIINKVIDITPLQKIKKLLNPSQKNKNEQENRTLSPSRIQNKINLISNKWKQNQWLNQKIPQFCVQKCRINYNANQNKSNINKPQINLSNLKYLYQTKCSYPNRINTCEAVKRICNDKIKSTTIQQFNSHSSKQRNQSIKLTQILTEQILMIKNEQSQLDQNKVANFIKGKKKKRTIFLQSQRKVKYNQFQFRRTVTDDFQKNKMYEKIQKGYYSPNKTHRTKFNIKLNSFDDNISGWQIKQNQNQKNHDQKVNNFQLLN